MSGTGDATLTITYQENTATTSRSDDFTVSGGSANATFSLTQNGAAAILVFNDLDTLEVPYSEGDTTAGLTSNCDWTVEVLTSDDADWVTVSPMNGSGNAILSVHCSENTNNFARTALIKVTGCDLVTEKMIHQDFLTGINDPVIKTNRSVYPNPCRTNINIELIKDDFRMEIINLQGQNALSRDVSIYSDREIQNWNISTLIPGTYLLKILNKEGVLVKKIIKN